ncbi:hypothetical protein E2C01_029746 [Portunus trituberculatus]|uniref:Uncharacterized protein n=1 Tax=Portunus trituberculatus TaxID=210409 RepID=A0A5B7EQ52_PORTR|nr:hypothetical protein [Portunus trituberculatus]
MSLLLPYPLPPTLTPPDVPPLTGTKSVRNFLKDSMKGTSFKIRQKAKDLSRATTGENNSEFFRDKRRLSLQPMMGLDNYAQRAGRELEEQR